MSNNNLDGKKKKIIVAVVSIVIVVATVAIVVFAVNGKNGKYVDTLVSSVPNNAETESVEIESGTVDNNSKETNVVTTSPTTKAAPTTAPTTEKTTKRPKSRYLYISVKLPIGNSTEDTLEILIDDKVVITQVVKTNGSSVTLATEEKYKGDVEVVARLVNYNTSVGGTISAGDNSKTLVLPLNKTEEAFGEDE